MLAKFSGVESERTASKFRIIIIIIIIIKQKKEVLCRGRAPTDTKCIQNKTLWERTFGLRIVGV